MRIIAGTHRGRQLAAPEGLATRPMTDRVRENLFNLLAADVPGAVALDLFCGSGALGLEAMSRGAASCLFVDADPAALAVVEANRRSLGLLDGTRVARGDALRPGRWIVPSPPDQYTLVFVDPPYKMTADPAGRRRLAAMAEALDGLGAVAPRAAAMVRVRRGTPMDAPWPRWRVFDERSYGTTTLYLMEHEAAPETPPETG
jgi:16S rRNA (guanine966-N2)-methyltransferase